MIDDEFEIEIEAVFNVIQMETLRKSILIVHEDGRIEMGDMFTSPIDAIKQIEAALPVPRAAYIEDIIARLRKLQN